MADEKYLLEKLRERLQLQVEQPTEWSQDRDTKSYRTKVGGFSIQIHREGVASIANEEGDSFCYINTRNHPDLVAKFKSIYESVMQRREEWIEQSLDRLQTVLEQEH